VRGRIIPAALWVNVLNCADRVKHRGLARDLAMFGWSVDSRELGHGLSRK